MIARSLMTHLVTLHLIKSSFTTITDFKNSSLENQEFRRNTIQIKD